jgi:glycine/D-amino acid oxidase-like deaminating enzyme
MSTRMSRIAVLGGGVGGLSAAHELAERGERYSPWPGLRTLREW